MTSLVTNTDPGDQPPIRTDFVYLWKSLFEIYQPSNSKYLKAGGIYVRGCFLVLHEVED
jgi:hypothetical protein